MSFLKNSAHPGALRLLMVALVLLAVVLVTGPPALAQTARGPSSSEPPPSLDERDVEAFMDGYVGHQLEDYNIPGATVSVVKDGEVVFARGYGKADVRDDEPVVADETLFRIASTSKLFTGTAVMQLVEEGQLDLDRDVNAYLDDVEIPDTYPGQPVTLRHLLTHTAGFEEHFTGSMARNADDVVPLGEHLSENVPARVRPPGESTSYSNYGVALAGHVVEEASGVPFERYVEENITGPLGMRSTTAAQPPAPELEERIATGYDVVEGEEPVARPFEYIDEAPAGSVSTTSTDMARFMIAHLQDGSYGGTRILDTATARQMHEDQFTNSPGLDGMALQFIEQTINGERTIQHGGNLNQFHANLVLLPEHDVGLFVAYNSYGAGGDFTEYELQDAFLDRYYPEESPDPLEPSAAEAEENAERFAGSYRTTRANSTGFEKVATLMTGVRVTANPDGSLTTAGGYLTRNPEETEQRWVRVAPATFRAEGGDERIAFRAVGSEGTTHLSAGVDPTTSNERLPFYESPRLHLGLLAVGFVVLLLSTLAWAAGATISWWHERRIRKLYGKTAVERKSDKPARRARLLASAVAVLALLFVVGMMVVLSNASAILGFGASPLLIGVLALPIVISVLTLGVLVHAALAWTRGYWGFFGRLQYSLVALSALAFVALLGYYNLIGFQV